MNFIHIEVSGLLPTGVSFLTWRKVVQRTVSTGKNNEQK
jgi:hypothetical protein